MLSAFIKFFIHFMFLFKNIILHWYFFNPTLFNPPVLDERLLVTIGARFSIHRSFGYTNTDFFPMFGLSQAQSEDLMIGLITLTATLIVMFAGLCLVVLLKQEIRTLEAIYEPLYSNSMGDVDLILIGRPYCHKAEFLKQIVDLMMNHVTHFHKYNVNGQLYYFYFDSQGVFRFLPVKMFNDFFMSVIVKGWPGSLHIPGWCPWYECFF